MDVHCIVINFFISHFSQRSFEMICKIQTKFKKFHFTYFFQQIRDLVRSHRDFLFDLGYRTFLKMFLLMLYCFKLRKSKLSVGLLFFFFQLSVFLDKVRIRFGAGFSNISFVVGARLSFYIFISDYQSMRLYNK